MRWYTADLHIHTCLSPCGDLLMSPKKIVAEAAARKLEIIAITDHNSAMNVSAVTNAASEIGIVVLPGMEVCTREEVHVLTIFDNIPAAMELQKTVYLHLRGKNDPQAFGDQVIANEYDEVEGFEPRLLIGATDITIENLVSTVNQLHGLAIASHIDRESFSVIGQLGFIPDTVQFDALEISANTSDEDASARFRSYSQYPFIRNSDAHFLNDIGKQKSRFFIEEATVQEIADALRNENRRMIQTVN